MKVEVIKNEKDLVEIRLEGERHSFPNLLKNKLLEDKSVDYVSYILDHPSDDSARLIVRTSGKSPKKAIEEAAKDIDAELDDFAAKLKKALK
ncbi:DNA-directed RNA polymerase subunit L [uncultured archaeon]|nr:DNA-directed RNA polymerase subunit L [uncultured archaeon]